ncbi:hypothetical protein [Amycolatopsis sp. PS_44_ISF1]|uniref:hypothetical protein n=1 Tax=Amycolatopsis sp. PS_44_ISF1 TaxID=2974917 RepID=UPI0028DD7DF9|nr:hypothetical protein [Amycolatopsis sp. PS_44_ISF1]MDT8913598.1 hypothetical protein [Amycolatopsis sp. PS_44_ISF1]
MSHDGEILTIPYDDLATVKGMLHQADSCVDSLTGGVPATPEAGEFSGAAGAVLAHLLDATAQVAIGLGAIGDAVGAAADAYRTGDENARDRVLQLWTT